MFIFYPIKIVGTPESPRLQTMGSNYFIEVSYYVPNLCLLVIALFGFFLTLVTFVCLMIFPLHQMKPNTKNQKLKPKIILLFLDFFIKNYIIILAFLEII